MTVRGRLAPTPSGRMHLGNAFSALLAWLSVRSKGGELLLRLEDLDRPRCREEYARQLEEDLLWLGLDWDRGGLTAGAEFRQSLRGEVYEAALAELKERGLLYPCFCSRAELHAPNAPHASDGRSVYSGRCRNLSEQERAELSGQRDPALRLRVPEEEVIFTDRICGEQRIHLARDWGDPLLRRSDGIYAYQLAVTVDDGLMGVTEVVRGRDLLSSAPLQMHLHRLLGFAPPEYAHVPLLLAADGRRLSKRDGDLDLGALRAKHGSPEPVLGQLAHWAGLLDRPEPASAKELLAVYDESKIPDHDVTVL